MEPNPNWPQWKKEESKAGKPNVEILPAEQTAEDEVYGKISNFTEHHPLFGDSFSMEKYWVEVLGFSPSFLNEKERKNLSEIFDELVNSGKFKKIEDGNYSIIKPQAEIVSEPIPEPIPEPAQEAPIVADSQPIETVEPEEQKFKIEEIDQELLKRLTEVGVKVELVEAQMGLVNNEDEKTFKIRQDANSEFVNQRIRDLLEKVAREKIEAKSKELGVQVLFDIDPNKTPDDVQDIYAQTLLFLENLSDEEKLKLKEAGDFLIENLNSLNEIKEKVAKKAEVVPEPTPEPETKPEPMEPVVETPITPDNPEPQAEVVPKPEPTPVVQEEIISAENKLNNLLYGLGIDLEFNNEHLKKFQDKHPSGLEEKSKDMLEALELFGSKNLKEKFSTIRFGYPKYEGDSKIFIEDNTLFVDLGIKKQEITDFLNNLFSPESKVVETAPEMATPDDFEVGNKIIWEGKEEIIKNNDGQWVSLESGKIVNLNALKESLKPKTEFNFQKEIELVSKIRDTKNFDELYGVLREVGGIHGSDKFYDSEELIGYIDHYRKFPGDIILSAITRSGNLREKVRELFLSENPSIVLPISEIKSEPTTVTEPASKPVAEPVLTPEPASVDQEELSQSEKDLNEKWEEFEKLRNDLAKTEAKENNYSEDTGKPIGELESDYIREKEKIAELIRKAEHDELGLEGPLTKEQESELNDRLFEELVRKENDVYLDTLKANRKETWKDKAKEAGSIITGTKAVGWYLKQNKWTKAAINTGLFGIAVGIGTFVGGGAASVALGATLYRGARAAGSIVGGVGGIGFDKALEKRSESKPESKIKFKKIETVEKEEEEEKEKIKKDKHFSLEEKSKKYAEIKEKYEKEKRWIVKRKAVMMIGGGILGGSITGGLLDYAYGGTGYRSDLAKSAESREGKASGVIENKLPPREGFKPPRPQIIEPIKSPISETLEPSFKVEPIKAPIQETLEPHFKVEPIRAPIQETLDKGVSAEDEINKMFENLENIKHIKVEGKVNSFWETVKKGLNENEQFKNFTEAQKQNAASFFTNKGIGNPEKYDLTPDPDFGVRVEAGKEVDLSKLFGDPEELKRVLSGAAKKTLEDQQDILDRSAKITTYLHEHPDVKLTNDKVADILGTKPKAEIPVEPIPKPQKLSPIESLGIGVPETSEIIKPEEIISESPHSPIDEGQIHEEIAEAKRRLEELKGGKKMRTMVGDVSVAGEVEQAFRNEIDGIYGKSGFLGMGKIAGIDTKEWGEIARLPATRVVEYYTGDSTKSGLASDVVEKLSKSAKHNAMASQMVGLMEQLNGAVKPFENESVEQFIKRLGSNVMKVHLQKAA